MFSNGHIPIIKLTSPYLEPWVRKAISDQILEAMQCGFKIVHGNNPKLHTAKKFDGTKTDAVLLVAQCLSRKKNTHWTHETIWAVREIPPHERVLRTLKGQIDLGFLGFQRHYEYLTRLGCPPTPTDEVVYSKRLGVPKPKKAPFESVMVDDWWRWDDCDWDDILAF